MATGYQKKFNEALENPEVFEQIITRDEKMLAIFEYIESIAYTDLPILITGETGVGKDLIARTIHAAGPRKGKFVSVNAAGLDDNMFSDTLFGHVRGAFTGADRDRKGLIEETKGGTLFLDEIGDLGASSQVKLLRLLQENEYMPLGLDKIKKTDARTISATNRDLWELQKTGAFRQDLNFRLRTHHINIPPLRERINDIPLLVDHFYKEAAKTLNRIPQKPGKEVIALLKTYTFPGNIRELQSMLFDAMSRSKTGSLSIKFLKAYIEKANRERGLQEPAVVHAEAPDTIIFPKKIPTIKKATEQLVMEAMRRANGVKSVAAGMLGVSRQALSKRLNKSA